MTDTPLPEPAKNGWTDNACQKDRIVDWFGPSDFRAAATWIAKGETDVAS